MAPPGPGNGIGSGPVPLKDIYSKRAGGKTLAEHGQQVLNITWPAAKMFVSGGNIH